MMKFNHEARNLQINWGRGRLRKYQSFESFIAQFCVLNLISVRQFLLFWKEATECYRNKRDLYEKNISKILDEPVVIVKTIFLSDEDTINKNNELNIRSLKIDSPEIMQYRRISFCHICISEGFHSSLHEIIWLRKCPFHHIDLSRISLNLPLSDGSYFERYVKRLSEMLDQSFPAWVKSTGNKNHTKIDSRTVTELADWSFFLKDPIDIWSPINITNKTYRYCHIDILLGRLAWIKPLSIEASELLTIQLRHIQPAYYTYESDFSLELKTLISVTSISNIIKMISIANLSYEQPRPYLSLAESAIQIFSNQHRKECSCKWGWSSNKTWTKFLKDVSPTDWGHLCLFECAAKELDSEWMVLFPNTSRNYDIKLHDYLKIIELFEAQGLVWRSGHYSKDNQMPLVEFKWSLAITAFFETVLLELVKAHIDELKYWLANIDVNSSPPSIRNFFPPNVYFSFKDNLCVLAVWPSR